MGLAKSQPVSCFDVLESACKDLHAGHCANVHLVVHQRCHHLTDGSVIHCWSSTPSAARSSVSRARHQWCRCMGVTVSFPNALASHCVVRGSMMRQESVFRNLRNGDSKRTTSFYSRVPTASVRRSATKPASLVCGASSSAAARSRKPPTGTLVVVARRTPQPSRRQV